MSRAIRKAVKTITTHPAKDPKHEEYNKDVEIMNNFLMCDVLFSEL